MTRIGDIGLLIGMILLFWEVGSFEYAAIFQAVSDGAISEGMITLTAILIFVGAIGKSGQFPLHTWLPDAMEGPTPVSALIHAATMVAAGVYLVAALFPLFQASEVALHDGCNYRCFYRHLCGFDCACTNRYKKGASLFYRESARLHDACSWFCRLCRRRLPLNDSCLF